MTSTDQAAIHELKEKLVIACRILDNEGLARPFGHVSVRIPGTDTFLIPRGIAPGLVTLDDLLVCNLEGKTIEGKYSKSYGEVMGHAGVYRRRKDIQSVAHTHSWNVLALSMTETTVLPASFESMKVAYEPIALYRKMAFLDNREVAEEVADLIGPNRAVILKGHGAIVVGRSIEEAIVSSVDLEQAAEVQRMASSVGKITLLTEREKETMKRFLKHVESLTGPASPFGRAWEYYASRVTR